MTRGTVQERIEMLEKTVAGLAELPGQMADVRLRLTSVESQIVRLEGRMEDGFSAIRGDLRQLTDSTNARFERVDKRFGQIDKRFEQVDQRFEQLIQTMNERFAQVDRRFDQMNRTMDERFEQTYTHMRVLHEKLVSDIRTLHEGRQ